MASDLLSNDNIRQEQGATSAANPIECAVTGTCHGNSPHCHRKSVNLTGVGFDNQTIPAPIKSKFTPASIAER
jgi:hypothetical protein